MLGELGGFRDENRWWAGHIGKLLFVIWAGLTLGTVALLERTLGRRRRFSYLDEYEKSS